MTIRLLLCCALALWTTGAVAEETRLAIRALAKDAKFIGSGMSGMEVVIRDADTGELLDRGVTRGSTGDTARLVQSPKARYDVLATPGAAAYRTALDLAAPRRITVTVRGPLAQPQAQAEASSTRWVLPGKHLDQGNGWLIEVPGLAVDILAPAAHSYVDGRPQTMALSASVMMLCGCGTSPGGLWDADQIEIVAHVRRDGEAVGQWPLGFAGRTSHFAVDIPTDRPGTYEVTVSAYDPRTGNTGLDRTSFIIS